MDYQTLALDIADGIAEIRFARPELLNRFDMPAHIEFAAALETVAHHVPDVRALVLSAEGRIFPRAATSTKCWRPTRAKWYAPTW